MKAPLSALQSHHVDNTFLPHLKSCQSFIWSFRAGPEVLSAGMCGSKPHLLRQALPSSVKRNLFWFLYIHMVRTATTLSHDTSSIFQPQCFLWNRFTDKRIKKCWCSAEDCVFVSASASLPHTAVHYLSVGQGKLSWGPIVCLREFWLCVFGTSTVHTGGVGGRLRMETQVPEESLGSGGGCLLMEALLGLLEGATHADSRTGRWGQSRKRC